MKYKLNYGPIKLIKDNCMAGIQQLGISGFRSYSSESIAKIQFERPVTLIWGKNGSGKTTIIECLKYMTTGSLPPQSDKGKSFVQDPSVAQRGSVCAQIRLKFRAYNGKQIIAKRKSVLTTQKKNLRFQSTEQSLQTKNQKGQIIEINHTCAEIQKQIPQLLGVSQSVLQNIIFCHQEESFWPFSDASTLKTIFDELFQTKRFTQIIEAYSQVIKQYNNEIKIESRSLGTYEVLFQEEVRKQCNYVQGYETAYKRSVQLNRLALQCERYSQPKYNIEALSERRNTLEHTKGMVQERIKQFQLQMKKIEMQYYQMSKEKIQRQNNTTVAIIQQIINETNMSIERLVLRIKQWKSMYDQMKQLTDKNNKELLLSIQIKRIKDVFPQLNDCSSHMIMNKLKQFQEKMKEQKQSIEYLKKTIKDTTLPIFLDQQITYQQYSSKSQSFRIKLNDSQNLKGRLIQSYRIMYKRSQSKIFQPNIDPNIQKRHQEVKIRIKIKQKELEQYEAQKPQQITSQQIFKIKFAGIELPEEQIKFTKERMKCAFCLKQVSQKQVEHLQNRCKKNKMKAQIHIAQLQKKRTSFPVVDSVAMALKVNNELTTLRKQERNISRQVQLFVNQRQINQQIKINQILTSTLYRLKIDSNQRLQTKPLPFSDLQSFLTAANSYQYCLLNLKNQKKQLSSFEERDRLNKIANQQYRNIQNQLKQKEQKLLFLQNQIKNSQFVQMSINNLGMLIKSTSLKKKSYSESENQNRSTSELQEDIFNLQIQKQNQQKKKKVLQIQLNYIKIKKQYTDNQQKLVDLQKQIISIQSLLNDTRQSLKQQQKILIQFQKKKQQHQVHLKYLSQPLSIKTQMSYWKAKSKILFLKKAISQLQNIKNKIDFAVSKYHSQKMQQVNDILKSVWRQIYHGNDIQLIEIKTEREEINKRKHYNYAIMMKKAGRLLQMRGRCSMGQKVLASIVIRLALAQSFAANARILALDQPTTNLDSEHINNLSSELNRLIQINENSKSFLLIIISHDLDFVKTLTPHTQHFYQVYRSPNNFSAIRKLQIQQINTI